MNEEQSHNPFVPSELDDAGLKPAQFRVLCHLWRRGETFSNTATIAKVCRLKRNTVFEVLSDLEKAGLIRRTSRPGQTTLIQPVPFGDTGRKANPSPSGIQGVTRLGIRDPSRLGIHKGNPTKATPLRKSQAASKTEIGSSLPFNSEAFSKAWQDWQQHRKEKKKPITPTSAQAQFRTFNEWGETRSITAIEHSIRNGWQGVFEPTSQLYSQKPQTIVNTGRRPSNIEEL